MISHSPAFELLSQAPVKTSDVKVVRQLQDDETGVYSDDNTALYESDGNLMSVVIDSVGQFLGTATKKATVKLIGIEKSSQAGDIFQIRLGLFNEDPSVSGFDYVSQGFYIVDNVKYDYDGGSTTITLYDHMWTATQSPYATGVVEFPITVGDLAVAMAQALGVDLMEGFEDLPNADYLITQDLYANINSATLQNVIAEIAATTGTTARISDYTLVFAKYQLSDESLNSDLLKTLKIGDYYGPITSVILGRVPQNDNIAVTNKTAASTTISSVNTTTNLITVTGNELLDGTLVQIESTGDMPGGLAPKTNYFVYTGGDANTFKLMTTWADAIAGTNAVDITSAGTGTISLASLPNQELQINNVEIMDDDRALLLPPLYGELLGVGWYAGNANTIGLPWHEVGDVISFAQEEDGTSVPVLIQEVHLTLAGSVQETLVSTIPDQEGINYQTAGGVIKTIYNTEIKVDKQNNEIQSIVSQQIQDGIDNQTAFTEVNQRVDNVTTQIQSMGGGNLILNSVGYAKETDGELSFWTHSGAGVITSYSSAASLSAGAVSGNTIQLIGAAGTKITQRINVANTSEYSFGFRVRKTLGDGSATVTIANDATSFTIPIDLTTAYVWQELKMENVTPNQNYWDVTVEITDDTESIEITDLRVLNGTTLVQWTQSQSEILNTQVALTTEGIRVSSNVYNGDFTVMTPLEFAGYSSASGSQKKVFWVNRDTTQMANAQVDGVVNFGNVIRAIPITSGSSAGLAFVGAIS